MLKTENNYDFRKRMSKVHGKNIRNKNLVPSDDEFAIKDGAKIVLPETAGEVLMTAAKDFADYLFVSQNVSVKIEKGLENAKSGDVFIATAKDTGDDLGEYASYKGQITTVSDTLKIIGHDERGAQSGVYFAEDMMSFKKAPFF